MEKPKPKARMKYLLTLFALASISSLAGPTAVRYEPDIVELKGVLDLQTFPVPPNYESIGERDDIERHFYLKLDGAVDAVPSRPDDPGENSQTERGVKVVQLAISEEDDSLWNRFRNAGKRAHVVVKGPLFHRLTGHHHSRVLLSVVGMKPIKH